MNTLYYYWSQVAYDKAQERRIRDLHNDPNLDPDNYMVPIEGAPGPGVMDLFEGTVSTESLEKENLPEYLSQYVSSDVVYRSVGMRYCNTL